MFGVAKTTSANGVKRTHFQCFGNPAVGHAETVQTDCDFDFPACIERVALDLGTGKRKTHKKNRAQDWNEIEIRVKGGVTRSICNGEILEEALKLPETGPIGLEADRGQMEYRRIRIKETP